MEVSPCSSQSVLDEDDVIDTADVGDVDDDVNKDTSLFSHASSLSSPPRDTISTPSSRAMVLHVAAAPQEPPTSAEVSSVKKHPSFTEEVGNLNIMIYQHTPEQRQVSSQAHWYVYTDQRVSKRSFEDPYFKKMLQVFLAPI